VPRFEKAVTRILLDFLTQIILSFRKKRQKSLGEPFQACVGVVNPRRGACRRSECGQLPG
jgi:hypothetical protein